MISIKDLKDLKGKRIILRVDFNVPLKNGKIIDDFRIKSSVPTINFLQKRGAKIIIIAHIGDGGEESLSVVAKRLSTMVNKFSFIKEKILGDYVENFIKGMKNGEVVLLENIRKEDGEKQNSPSFARAISRYGDIYINDAFSVSHRKHASIIGISKYINGYAGLQLQEEIKNLSKSFNAQRPFTFILGGSKFDTKIPLIKKFLKNADNVFIGGAIANDFLKAKGLHVGKSLVGNYNSTIKSFLKKNNLILPTDVIVLRGNMKINIKTNEILDEDIIMDIGKETTKNIIEIINNSKFVLWNGPLGKYEDGFDSSSKLILKAMSLSKAFCIVGGGDTVSLVNKLKLQNKLGFVSTGGGATLDFLANGTLPGIKALK